jgi:CSLREA domain-containing protein
MMLSLTKRIEPLVILFIFMTLLVSHTLTATPVSAAVIMVNSAIDVVDDSDGFCTLREAILAANSGSSSGAAPGECPAGTGTDTIIVPGGIYTLNPALGQLPPVTQELTIIGDGATTTIIQASDCNPVTDVTCTHEHRVFSVNVSGDLTLEKLTIRNGNKTGTTDNFGGGAVNYGKLHLVNSIVSGNRATYGAGVNNYWPTAATTITGSRITGNHALDHGGGVYGYSALEIINCAISGNFADRGAGIFITSNSVLALVGSIVTDNHAVTDAGGIFNNGILTVQDSSLGRNTAGLGGGIRNYATLTIVGSTLFENESTSYGGGIYNSGTLDIINSTFTGNNSVNNSGGGIFNTSGNLSVSHSTFAHNSAKLMGGGIYNYTNGNLSFANTIITHSTPHDCYNVTPANILINSHNLVVNNADSPYGCGIPYMTANPEINTLGNYGGPTKTHALDPSSPAIDAADPAYCTLNDQRGVRRPQGFACDIGAFELEQGSAIFLPLILK